MMQRAMLWAVRSGICSLPGAAAAASCHQATDFLEACQVLPNPERLVLVKAITIVMSTCLRLLGITPLEKI